ncbi:MAG TPA: ubiquitin-like small modifier protein 1 [Actinomycetota bacterium]|nr:ubiquitin-like small modifier protein 1 [Actinomycetota bacterium]
MPVVVNIPSMLRGNVGGAHKVDAEPGTLRDVVNGLVARYPSLSEQLLGEGGELHKFVNVYVNDEDVRYMDGLDTKVSDGDVLAILPAVAGGAA